MSLVQKHLGIVHNDGGLVAELLVLEEHHIIRVRTSVYLDLAIARVG